MGDDSVGFWCAFPMTVTGLTSIPLLLWVMTVLGFGVPSPWLSLGLPRSLYYYGWWQCWVLVCLLLSCHRAYLHPFIIMYDDSVGFWCAFPSAVTGPPPAAQLITVNSKNVWQDSDTLLAIVRLGHGVQLVKLRQLNACVSQTVPTVWLQGRQWPEVVTTAPWGQGRALSPLSGFVGICRLQI